MKHRVFVVLLLFAFKPGAFAIQAWQQQVEQSIQQRLGEQIESMAQKMGLDDYHYQIEQHYLDSRLNLPSCQDNLHISPPMPLKLGRNHIKVACKSGVEWAINVPVEVKLFTLVVVLNQPISKGLTLQAQHLDYVSQNLAAIRNGYYLKKEQVIGKQSKRALAGQTVMNSHVILPALMVRKGDHVMIVASKGVMSVKMPGEALSDGREGRQIRVKNTRSQRIIKARVVAQGQVEVHF